MRRTLGILGPLAVAGLLVPPLAALVAKARLQPRAGAPFDETADEIDLVVIFDGVEASSRAASFRGGSVLTWYGGGNLDLREATLDPSGGRLRLRSIFGGMRVLVPPTWRVEVHSVGVFGGVGNDTDASTADPASPALVIDAIAAFGGAMVTSRVQDTDED